MGEMDREIDRLYAIIDERDTEIYYLNLTVKSLEAEIADILGTSDDYYTDYYHDYEYLDE